MRQFVVCLPPLNTKEEKRKLADVSMAVLLETTLGDIVIDLFTDERPKTCLNFLKLCKIKHYNYCLIHNVQRDFIMQTGDPTGTGRGGESVYSKLYGDQARYFDREKVPRIKHRKMGTVSMVNNGNDQHGSQQEDCEKAYFKMDNVLIDDRRIHVDFSQSVSKIKWKGKGGKYTKDDFKAYEKDVETRSKLTLKDQVKPKQDSKYDLLIEEEEEEEATSHRHSDKKHKEKRHHHHSESDNRKSKKHKDGEDNSRERKMGRQRSRSFSRSRSRDRDHKHGKSRDKHGKDGRDKSHSRKDRSRSRESKKSKDKERSRHR
uniref:Peptidyl-prolyl cis-trans isomerase n=1 Tax=Labrus bergylta TaxID=56723 RepID=A0A3Q3M5B5_9LABR